MWIFLLLYPKIAKLNVILTFSDVPCAACAEEHRNAPNNFPVEYAGQRLLDMGRPIPQYLPAQDPVSGIHI